jgi:hypothetical protein
MATAPRPSFASSPGEISFQDGLGIRYLGVDPATGDHLERLCLSFDLGRQVQAVEDRISRLLNFRHARFPRVRGVEVSRLADGANVVWAIAEPVEGVRVIELLRLAEMSRLLIDVNTTLQLAREVLPALATLHDSRGITHAALGPERLVLTPQARVMVVDHQFGAAIAKLQYPRTRLWREFRIAMPPAASAPRFDARADVAMVAMTVLALLIGRPVTLNEFPEKLRDLLDRARERFASGRERALSAGLRAWLERTLPIESRRPLATALEAQMALEDAIKKDKSYAPGVSALKHFLERVEPVLTALRAARRPETDGLDDSDNVLALRLPAPAPVAPAPPPAATSRPSKKAPKRPSPDEEEAEEIAFLERELARLAAEGTGQPAPPAAQAAVEPLPEATHARAAIPVACAHEPAPAPAPIAMMAGGGAHALPESQGRPAPVLAIVPPPDIPGSELGTSHGELSAALALDTIEIPIPLTLAVVPSAAPEDPGPAIERAETAQPDGLALATSLRPAATLEATPEVLAPAPPATAAAYVPPPMEAGPALVEILHELPRRLSDSPVVEFVEFVEGASVQVDAVDVAPAAFEGASAVPALSSGPSGFVPALAESGHLPGVEAGNAAADVVVPARSDAASEETPAAEIIPSVIAGEVAPAEAFAEDHVDAEAWCLVPPPWELPVTVCEPAEADRGQLASRDEFTLHLDFERMHHSALLAADSEAGTGVALPAISAKGAGSRLDAIARDAAATPLARAIRPIAPLVGEEVVARGSGRRSVRARKAVGRRSRRASGTSLPERSTAPIGEMVRPPTRRPLSAVLDAGARVLAFAPGVRRVEAPVPTLLADRSVVELPAALVPWIPPQEEQPAVECATAPGVLAEDAAVGFATVQADALVADESAPCVLSGADAVTAPELATVETTAEPPPEPATDAAVDTVVADADAADSIAVLALIDAEVAVEAAPEADPDEAEPIAEVVHAAEPTPDAAAVEANAPAAETLEADRAGEPALRAEDATASVKAAAIAGAPEPEAVVDEIAEEIREEIDGGVVPQVSAAHVDGEFQGTDRADGGVALEDTIAADPAGHVRPHAVPSAEEQLAALLEALRAAEDAEPRNGGAAPDDPEVVQIDLSETLAVETPRRRRRVVAIRPPAVPDEDTPSSRPPLAEEPRVAEVVQAEAQAVVAGPVTSTAAGSDAAVTAQVQAVAHREPAREAPPAIGSPEAEHVASAVSQPVAQPKAEAPRDTRKRPRRPRRRSAKAPAAVPIPEVKVASAPVPESLPVVPAEVAVPAPVAESSLPAAFAPLAAPALVVAPAASVVFAPVIAPAPVEALQPGAPSTAPIAVVAAPAEPPAEVPSSSVEVAQAVASDGRPAPAAVHAAFPAIESTLPQYAPWLTPEPLPPGAAEANAIAVPASPGHSTTPGVARPSAAVAAEDRQDSASASGDAASRRSIVVPFAPPAASTLFAGWDERAPGERAADPPAPDPAAAWPGPSVSPSRINWRRTLAASVVMMLVTGAAFAMAYWFTLPPATGHLVVHSSAEGVDVLVDGRARGQAPLRVELSAGRHVIEMHGHGVTRTLPVEIAAGVQTSQYVKWPLGRASGTLKVTSTPPGARVLVDGEMRGITPVEIEGVIAGTHALTLESESGVVKRSVKVVPGEAASVDVAIFSGWLAVFAPFHVRVFEGNRLLGTSEDGKILLPPGKHDLDLVNKTLGVRESRTIDITPGGTTAVSLEAPGGAIAVDAPEGTEVWIDGERKGTAPMEAVSVSVGTREVVLRHPQLGQRRLILQVGATATSRASFFTP